MTLLPSFRRQQLLLDFASLQISCPEGIYLSVAPENPAQWTGVLFVRSGPYEPAVLRFEISFPSIYPDLPPLITFSSDIFHPLCVPSTVYTFSTGALDAVGTVSASDEERLPPGSFSLRHGFPEWYGRQGSLRTSLESNGESEGKLDASQGRLDGRDRTATANGLKILHDSRSTTLKVLQHLKASFADEEFLDNIPLEAAGNPSAWHAWRAHRGLTSQQARGRSPAGNEVERAQASPRNPGEWNWDGVWESRVQEGIDLSTNEAVLYTSIGRVRFSKLEDDQFNKLKREMLAPHE